MDTRADLEAALGKGIEDGIPAVELAGLRARLAALGGGWGAAVPASATEVVAKPAESAARIDEPVVEKAPAKPRAAVHKPVPVAKKRK